MGDLLKGDASMARKTVLSMSTEVVDCCCAG